MSLAVREQPMAKKGRPPKPTGKGRQVRIDSDLVPMARFVSDGNDVALSDYLSGLLRPLIERDFREAGRRLAEKAEKPKKGKP